MTKSISIESSSPDRSAIKLVFEQGADRWEHHWSAATADAEHPVLNSVEGTPNQNWPPSPPLQDISQHTLEPGNAVLCVGMAGKNFWSASYSIEKRNQSEQATLIKSELACLQKNIAPHSATLGSSYEINSLCEIQSFTADRIEILSSEQTVIVLEAMSSHDFETVFELTDKMLGIRPRQISKNPLVATRWGFRVVWAPPGKT